MNNQYNRVFLANFLLCLLLVLPHQLLAKNELNKSSSIKSVWKEKRASHYQNYSSKNLKLAESIFEQLLLNQTTEKLRQKLRSLNLTLIETGEFLLISEAQPPYTGQGLYVIRASSAGTPVSPVLLQAPHGYYDLKTGSIAIKIMQENAIRALAVNTVHRRIRYVDKARHTDNKNADMAHLSESLLMAFSRAFAKVVDNGRIIQLHGFNADKRPQTRQLDMIISNGTSVVSQQLISQKDCIDRALSTSSKIYSLDISILGGEKNRIGQAVRKQDFSGFNHIEMSLPLRKKLNRSARQRRAFSQCFAK